MLRGDDSTRDCFAGCPGGELPGKPSRSNVFHTASLRPLLFRSLRAGREFHVNGAGAHSAEAFLRQDTRGNGIYYEIGACRGKPGEGHGESTQAVEQCRFPLERASRRDRNSAPERLKQTRQIPCYPAVPGDNGGGIKQCAIISADQQRYGSLGGQQRVFKRQLFCPPCSSPVEAREFHTAPPASWRFRRKKYALPQRRSL